MNRQGMANQEALGNQEAKAAEQTRGAVTTGSVPVPELIQKLTAIADEIFESWDKDQRSGKLLLALTGALPRYRADVSEIRRALATHATVLSALHAAIPYVQRVASTQPTRPVGKHKQQEAAELIASTRAAIALASGVTP